MMTEPEDASHFGASMAAPRIFALVVGIDQYRDPKFDNLTGCRNDGKRFIKYLTDVLGVPSSQVVFLADERATEQAILNEFDRFLIGNADIKRDDAMVFFFAGHGRLLLAPEGWVTESGTIEALCPYDVQTIGDNGEELWGIPDRTIDAKMRELAFEKGDNIIAVFDCCFSGGLSRDQEDTLRARALPPHPHPPPANLHRNIWSSISEPSSRVATTVVQTGFKYKAMESHVLLAACRPDELALENPSAKDGPGGLFTSALIESLRRHSLHDTSYASLFEMLNLHQKRQHPQCEGTNKNRLLFSVNTLYYGKATYKVYQNNGRLYVSAGSIHGVVEGTKFTVRSRTETFTLKACKVRDFASKLEKCDHSVTDARAFVSHWGHPTLKIHSSVVRMSALVTVVPAEEPADIALRQSNSGWELERLDPLIPLYSTPMIRFNADDERMTKILDAVANFNSYLYRSAGGAAAFAGKVKTRLNRVAIVRDEFGPVGDDLLEGPRLSHAGVDVKVATITRPDYDYCLTLENYSEVDLFPYLFYFDPSSYEIQAWYIPQGPTTTALLKGRKADGTPSVFPFGYGAFGTNPIEFYLPEGQEVDTVFLKIFLTTAYVDMSPVEQPGIDEVSPPRSRSSNRTLAGTWTSETFVLTCRRS